VNGTIKVDNGNVNFISYMAYLLRWRIVEVDSLHVKRNKVVGVSYLEIKD
jgi:hypothetical protein